MHDPIDSLLYVNQSDLVGAIRQQIESEFDPESPHVEKLLDLVEALHELINRECSLHHDNRTSYSTGVPFEVKKTETYVEPRPDGVGQICEREVWVAQYPTQGA